MPRVYVFADEAGNFDFSRVVGASRYFILTTVACKDCGVAARLLDLRRTLAWGGLVVDKAFHAAEDKQLVRDAVFSLLSDCDLRIDATILEKCKTQGHLRADTTKFYRMAWWIHFKHVAPRIAPNEAEMLVVASSLRTRGKEAAFRAAVYDVVHQVRGSADQRTVMWDAATEPCLQIYSVRTRLDPRRVVGVGSSGLLGLR